MPIHKVGSHVFILDTVTLSHSSDFPQEVFLFSYNRPSYIFLTFKVPDKINHI